ncbi:MAG: ABC transporter permease [Thermodesulfobacteriota bacterium]|nr:ABC transporter permease [Thermodesulfobacteriota bacterium]
MKNRLKQLKPLWSILPVAIFLGVWEIVTRLGLIPGKYFFPSFSTVIREFYTLMSSGILVDNFLKSLQRVLIGFFTGSIAGLFIGIMMGWKDSINNAFHPIFSLLYPIPALGWLPILMLWFGIGEILPIAIIFICSFFPVLYNTITGIKTVNRDIVKVAETLGASNLKILLTILLPLAIPNIFTGLRLEAGMAWRVIIAAEMVAIPTGIGALLMRAESLLRIDIIIVCLMILSVMCLSFEKFFLFLEKRLTDKWK